MMTCFLKRATPFILTLIIGIGLGSVFGFKRPQPETKSPRLFWGQRHCSGSEGGGVSPGRYRHNRDSSTPMHIDFKPEATYTEAARRHGFTGEASLRVEFRADGTIGKVTALNELPYDLNAEAIEAAHSIRFTPATFNGQPTSTMEVVEFEFGERLPAVLPAIDE